jgi:hypothetical protein
MATTICIICFCYLCCNVPPVFIRIFDVNLGFLSHFLSSFYWMQYSLNFVVYAASNKQYREAYLLFLREAVFCLDREAAGPAVRPSSRKGEIHQFIIAYSVIRR